VHEVAPGIDLIDSRMGGFDGATSAYLVKAREPALIETGPTTSLNPISEALRARGMGPDDLAHILVTHVHLDHAGGVGAFARRFPKAIIWAHEKGAPHLADPRKLEASATKAFGEEHMRTVFGPISPVPRERLRSLTDGGRIPLGDRSLDVVYSPGHAKHHVYYVDQDTGALFSGDALGVSLAGAGILRPATPPPDFDLTQALASIDLVVRRKPPVVLLSHFGPVRQVQSFCALAAERLRRWAEIVERALQETEEVAEITRRLVQETASDEQWADVDPKASRLYNLLLSHQLNAVGLIRYLRAAKEPSGGHSALPTTGP